MQITFRGACRTVTGSSHEIQFGGKRVLLDCGFFQGKRAEANEKNRWFAFPPAEVDAVILFHAHIDHSGKLPKLAQKGFCGPIYATGATVDLCQSMLAASSPIAQTAKSNPSTPSPTLPSRCSARCRGTFSHRHGRHQLHGLRSRPNVRLAVREGRPACSFPATLAARTSPSFAIPNRPTPPTSSSSKARAATVSINRSSRPRPSLPKPSIAPPSAAAKSSPPPSPWDARSRS